MLSLEKINRINELAHKSKKVGLTPEEKSEQDTLRKEYIAVFRNNLKITLESLNLKPASTNNNLENNNEI